MLKTSRTGSGNEVIYSGTNYLKVALAFESDLKLLRVVFGEIVSSYLFGAIMTS